MYYHATPAYNAATIEEDGLKPHISRAMVDGWCFGESGIYMFNNLDSAMEYGYLNHTEIVVFAIDPDGFDADALIEDLEYEDGESWILPEGDEGCEIEACYLEIAYRTEA